MEPLVTVALRFQVAISAGKYTLTIKFMGITLLTQSGNICDGSTLQLQHALFYILPGSLANL